MYKIYFIKDKIKIIIINNKTVLFITFNFLIYLIFVHSYNTFYIHILTYNYINNFENSHFYNHHLWDKD